MNLITQTLRRFSAIATLTALVGGSVIQANAQAVTGVQPTSGTIDVPLNASIVFTFDVPIEPATLNQTAVGGIFAGSLQWSANIDPFKMVPTWSAGNKVLTLNYLDDLPGSSLISWEINPVGGFLKLADEETFFPVANISGNFTTVEGSNCDPDGVPDSFGKYNLFKNLIYLQSSTAAPVIDPEFPAFFAATVRSPTVNAVLGANLKLPGGSTIDLPFFLNMYSMFEGFDSQAEMDTAYPAGDYEMTMTRSIPPATVVNMAMPSGYPPTPRVANHTAAQTVNAALDFTLEWDAFAGVTADDLVLLSIEDGDNTVFEAPDLCAPVDLPNTATSIVIPGGTLMEGKVYAATLSFYRGFHFSTNSPAEFLTTGALIKATQFTINTGGSVVVPQPQLSTPAFSPGGIFGFTANNLLIGTGYRVEFSTSLLPGTWTLLELLTAASASEPIVDNSSSAIVGQRFYRIIKQ